MGTIVKNCTSCGVPTIHNESEKKENPPRCTRCAQPYGTGPKRERHEADARRVGRWR